MWLYQCWSSLDLKLFTVGATIILSGNEFQLFITLSHRGLTSSLFL